MKKILIVSALVFALLPLWAVYHKLGDFATLGNGLDIQVVDNTAYIAEGNAGLQIVDVSNPQNPVLWGSYVPSGWSVQLVAVEDNLACIVVAAGTQYRLQVIDVSIPQNPVLQGSFVNLTHAYDLDFRNNIAYIADGNTGLRLIDVSNPQNPVLVGSYNQDGAYCVTTEDDLAYIVSDCLRIIDVSNPANPVQLGWYYVAMAWIGDVTVTGYYACVTESNGMTTGLEVLDVSNPQNPTPLGGYGFGIKSGMGYIMAEGNAVYGIYATGAIMQNLQAIGISDPLNPTLLGSYETPDNATSLYILDGRAFVAGSDSLMTIIDVTNPQNPALLGSYDTYSIAYSVRVEDDIAYVANGSAGLQIIDATNPQNPILLGSYATGVNVKAVTLENDIAYMANGSAGLLIVNVDNPQLPTLTGSYNTPGDANDVAVVGSIAYVADKGSGLQIISVADPASPSLLGSIDTPGSANSVTVANGIAYVADAGSGLQIISVTNPQNPALLSSCDTPGDAVSIVLYGSYAFIADGGSGVQVIDVSNPALPAVIYSIQPHPTGYINQCYIHGDQLFMSDINWNEISVYDIIAPQSPGLLNRYAWNLVTYGMYVSGDELYTANRFYTLNIHDLTAVDVDDPVHITPSAFQMRNSPNPFNPETTISYTLPSAGLVSLEIYNSRGQLVRSLLKEEQPAGEHSLVWNGKDDSGHSVASGLYLCRIACNGKQETRKMLLIK